MTTIELIYARDCPNLDTARERLRTALAAAGLPCTWREWQSDALDAPKHARGYGSPTILVSGRDVAANECGNSGACCRVYTADGELQGAPSVEAIRAALHEAARMERGVDPAGTPPRANLRSVIAALPTVGVALLPKLTCAACWPAYAGVLSALGVGFADYTPYVLPTTMVLLAATLLILLYKARRRHGYQPFILGTVAALVLALGKFVVESDLAVYSGIVLLLGASLWHAWPVRREAACNDCPT